MEETNKGLKTSCIEYLHRKSRANRIPSAHRLVVASTDDPHAADKCIHLGFFINSLRHKVEEYAPQLNISLNVTSVLSLATGQHTANGRRNVVTVLQNTTKRMTAKVHNIARCKGNHQAWSLQC